MKIILKIFILSLYFQSVLTQNLEEEKIQSFFNQYDVDGCFILYNQASDEYIRYNTVLCETGYIPASTFKIPNAIIALEEGIIQDTNEIIIWNGHKWPNEPWNQDQTLKTAIKYSCIWVFIDIAEKVGIEKYYEYVNSFDYGNKDLTGPPTRFWLAGLFRISANQQIDFLKKFKNYELDVSMRSIDLVKDIIVLEETDNYKLSGKSGSGILTDTTYIMWQVGYIEKDNNTWFYAINYETNDIEKTRKARLEITKDVLKELELIEK